jgi:Fe2+ transport system protein FeoA
VLGRKRAQKRSGQGIERQALDILRPGQQADVVGVDVDTPTAFATRLRDLGIHPGSQVHAVRRAPLGSPVVYRFDEVSLALRRSEANRILIRRIR